MNRRDFLRGAAAGAVFLVVPWATALPTPTARTIGGFTFTCRSKAPDGDSWFGVSGPGCAAVYAQVPPDNEWHDVAIWMSPTASRAWVDGQSVPMRSFGGAPQNFGGQFALSIYREKATAPQPALISSWKFNTVVV